jgi:hemerythrin superfamily protein
MNAIDLLTMQHNEIGSLFDQCLEAEGDEKQVIFDRIADALTVHATIEEQHFYPSIKTEETEGLLEESVVEHYEVKRMIAELIDLGADDKDFDVKLNELKEAVQHHVKELEEPTTFPLARKILDEDQLEAIGELMTETMVTLEAEGAPREQVFEELDQPAQI